MPIGGARPGAGRPKKQHEEVKPSKKRGGEVSTAATGPQR